MSEDVARPGQAIPSAGDLLHLVRTGQASTRGELHRHTGLSRTAVVARVTALVEAGLLVPGEELASSGGRPPGALVFNQDAGVVLAIAVGRSRSQLAVFDLEGRELAGDTRDHEIGVGPDELMPQVAERLGVLLDGVMPAVLGIGMSLPGTVDPDRGVSVDSPVMRGWDGVRLATYLTEVSAAPLMLANDSDVLAHAELFGRPDAPRDALVVKASTGLGLGLIVDGRVVSGAAAAAGEIGHTRIEDAGDLRCRCGRLGCLETVAGGWALVARLVESGREAAHIRDLVTLALEGDSLARALLRESGRQQGEVLAVAVNLLNPSTVVIGGDMAGAFDLVVAGIRESIYLRSTTLATRDLTFRPGVHGDSAGLVGCAALVIDRVLAAGAVDRSLGERRGAS